MPYLRGKQFELIALRDLADLLSRNELIFPIVEPVNPTTVTLEKTIDVMRKHDAMFGLVVNPEVGNIKGEAEIEKLFKLIEKNADVVKPAVIINNKSSLETIKWVFSKLNTKTTTLILTGLPNNVEDFSGLLNQQKINKALVDEKNIGKRLLRQIRSNGYDLILLADHFNMQKRNVDYTNAEDEFFGDDHLFYDEEGYAGFSDYLTIGKEYSDTGFLPYAVTIHLTYFNDKEDLRIRHFVSDDVEDPSDIAGKFGQALSKLVDFVEERQVKTRACKEFQRLNEEMSYPGLGSIKKLSLMHHIELIHDFLKSKR